MKGRKLNGKPKRRATRRPCGFTLVELMITVMVIGVLSAIAFPNYTQYVQRSNRVQGKTALLKLAGAQERYFTVNNQYTSDLAALGAANYSGESATGSKYDITVIAATGKTISTTYVITATPRSTDATCGSLTLDYLGNKGQTLGTQALCW
jgi:type IV pilus assembly protein PilE